MSHNVLHQTIQADGVDVFYRSAGSRSAPAILLLHGFPTSSAQFRNLIPLLSRHYHVVAPDLPGFGFTVVPENRKYKYTFDNLATTVQAFVDALQLKQFAIYVFDYGAPVGFRLATHRPSQITGIITQNGNAYAEGLDSPFWDPLKIYWESSSSFDSSLASPEAQSLLPFLQEGPTKWQYTEGVPTDLVSRIDPAAYTLDAALMQRSGQDVIQLSLFFDYRSNVSLYPSWQEYLRKEKPKVLVMWGKNDIIFPKGGAEAYKRDVPDAEFILVDGGHFPLETHFELYAEKINAFMGRCL